MLLKYAFLKNINKINLIIQLLSEGMRGKNFLLKKSEIKR